MSKRSRVRIPVLGGHFFTFICCKNCNVFEKTKNKLKEAGVGPF